jgi:agmatinase
MKKRAARKELGGCFASPAEAAECRLVFAGLCCDCQSSYRRGSAQGPRSLRRAYDADCYNSSTELGVDLAGCVADGGAVRSSRTWKATAGRIQRLAEALFAASKVPFFAGGDHAVTIPVARALAALRRPVHVVQFDAHPDLYDEFEGDRESHACVGARILELPHVASLTQIGIRTMNAPQRQTARRYAERLHLLEARQISGEIPIPAHIPHGANVYITLDLDVFDPADAPGVSHPVPAGLTPRALMNFLQQAPWNLVGMDVVELNPRFDQGQRTTVLAARLLLEGMGKALFDLQNAKIA